MHTFKQVKAAYPQCTVHTQVAIFKYGRQACMQCYAEHQQGADAKAIGAGRGLSGRQAACAVAAGRELATLGLRADDTPPKPGPADDDIIGQPPRATVPPRAAARQARTTLPTLPLRAPTAHHARPDTHPGTWSAERIEQARELVRSAIEIVNRNKEQS